MADDDRPDDPSHDELIAELLRGVRDGAATTSGRDRVRSAMLDEFDAIIGETTAVPTRDSPSVDVITDQPDRETDSTSPTRVRWLTLVAAVSLLVVSLAVVAVTRRDQAPADRFDQPTTPSLSTLPPVADDATPLPTVELPVALADERYRTDEVGGGLTFAGAVGLELTVVDDGIVVLEAVGGDGSVDARLTLYDAEPATVDSSLDQAVAEGFVRVDAAQFASGGQRLARRDVTVTPTGLEALACAGQGSCVQLLTDGGDGAPAIWGRSENFLVELRPGALSTYVLVQSTRFGDPFIGQASEIIASVEFDSPSG